MEWLREVNLFQICLLYKYIILQNLKSKVACTCLPMFAVVGAGSTWDEMFIRASDDMVMIENWFYRDNLTISLKKFHPIFLRNDAGPGSRILSMHSCGHPGSVVCRCGVVECCKYLGILYITRCLGIRTLIYSATTMETYVRIDAAEEGTGSESRQDLCALYSPCSNTKSQPMF